MEPYYQDSLCTIYHADCRETVTQISADVLITDPPYGVGFSGKSAKERGGCVKKISGGYCFDDTPQYIANTVVPTVTCLIGNLKRAAITPGTRCMFLYPTPSDVGCFYSSAGTGLGRWGFTCMQPILFYGSDPYFEHAKGARPNSLGQSYPNDANKTGHPCAKPFPMWRWLVNRASWDGDIILDPFMGSGTTLRVAKDLGRKAIGIEIEEKYCEIAAKRLAQEVLPL